MGLDFFFFLRSWVFFGYRVNMNLDVSVRCVMLLGFSHHLKNYQRYRLHIFGKPKIKMSTLVLSTLKIPYIGIGMHYLEVFSWQSGQVLFSLFSLNTF